MEFVMDIADISAAAAALSAGDGSILGCILIDPKMEGDHVVVMNGPQSLERMIQVMGLSGPEGWRLLGDGRRRQQVAVGGPSLADALERHQAHGSSAYAHAGFAGVPVLRLTGRPGDGDYEAFADAAFPREFLVEKWDPPSRYWFPDT